MSDRESICPIARLLRRDIGNRQDRRETVGRALHAATAAIEHVGVEHGGLDVAVAEELLHSANIVACCQEMGRDTMSFDTLRYSG
jgi:hypothetical protein